MVTCRIRTQRLAAGWLAAFALAATAAGTESPAGFWERREARLEPSELAAARVRIAIWDSGVDAALFGDRVARDASDRLILRGYDAFKQRHDTAMAELPEGMLARRDELNAILQALDDRDGGIDSPAARDITNRLEAMSPAEAAEFNVAIGRWSGYAHGTGVADIALAGNPHAQIVIARMEWWHGDPPTPCWNHALADREAESIADLLRFVVDNGAVVVNMSWGRAERSYLSNLEACAPEMPEADRLALARYTVVKIRDELIEGMRQAPHVLFVGAAGNAGSDMKTANPATRFSLPNFLLVGAVDGSGNVAPWTNTGPEVTLYANGERVPARLPGGELSFPSGTSMAVPLVVNAAAKVLAIHPALDGAGLRTLLEGSATRNADGKPLLHPAMAVAEARRQAQGRTP